MEFYKTEYFCKNSCVFLFDSVEFANQTKFLIGTGEVMPDFASPLITNLIAGLVVVLFEYFVLQKKSQSQTENTQRKISGVGIAIILSLSLFAPLLILQQISLRFAIDLDDTQSRITWYGHIYAVLAMLWGWFWGVKVRPWLQSRF